MHSLLYRSFDFFMRCFLNILLILAVGTFYTLGGYVAVHVSHTHDVSQDHDHSHHSCEQIDQEDEQHGHSHTPCNEHPDPCDFPDSGSKCPSHEHCHVKNLGGDSPLLFSDPTKVRSPFAGSCQAAILGCDTCPDGPYFGLIKPPQLG